MSSTNLIIIGCIGAFILSFVILARNLYDSKMEAQLAQIKIEELSNQLTISEKTVKSLKSRCRKRSNASMLADI